jgi:hypothetical protein
VCPSFDYDQAKATKTLVDLTNLAPDPIAHIPAAGLSAKTRRHVQPSRAKQGGICLDTQLTRVVQLCTTYQVPLRAFFDAAERKRFLKTRYPDMAHPVRKELSNTTRCLLTETELALRMFEKRGLLPIATQRNVRWQNKIQTWHDVVVRDQFTGCERIVEMKRGCAVSYGQRGKMMRWPFQAHPYSTMFFYLLQTEACGIMQAAAAPASVRTGPPLLLQCHATLGASLYEVPAYITRKRAQFKIALCKV